MESLYETVLKPPRSQLHWFLGGFWQVVGLTFLVSLAWFGFGSQTLFNTVRSLGVSEWVINYIGTPITMMFRAVLIVESIGYIYHRWFQHVSFWTRRAQTFRRNQRFHWIHHMIIYPIGSAYRTARAYVKAEKGISWSWIVPGLIVAALFFLHHGFNLGGVVFVASIIGYAKFIVSNAHSMFHVENHRLAHWPYFQWLEKIHILHHWDQRCNFTIVHPLLDMLFGTYLSPARHQREIDIASEDRDLTASDLINWRYLLIEANPEEYAAFISEAKTHPKSIDKLHLLLDLLRKRTTSHPEDAGAEELLKRGNKLLTLVS